jgi:hypothetical protein
MKTEQQIKKRISEIEKEILKLKKPCRKCKEIHPDNYKYMGDLRSYEITLLWVLENG